MPSILFQTRLIMNWRMLACHTWDLEDKRISSLSYIIASGIHTLYVPVLSIIASFAVAYGTLRRISGYQSILHYAHYFLFANWQSVISNLENFSGCIRLLLCLHLPRASCFGDSCESCKGSSFSTLDHVRESSILGYFRGCTQPARTRRFWWTRLHQPPSMHPFQSKLHCSYYWLHLGNNSSSITYCIVCGYYFVSFNWVCTSLSESFPKGQLQDGEIR